MNEYNFNVKFEKGRISSNLKKLVQNDYNSTKINFTFDKEGRKLFKMLYPDETAYITQIDNDELIFGPGVLSQDGIYEVEIALYTENGRLTDYATTKFDVRAELIQSDEIVELDDRLPILDSLINDVQGVKTGIEDAIQYATEQGDYAKEQANRNFDAIEEATKIVDNFEENVNEYKEDFDNNAIFKTNDFNSNVDEKTTIFDNHVIDGIDTFNTNATTKLNEYNANADDLMTIAVDTRNELERIKNDVLETGEASDIFVHLKDSTMAEYQELEVEGVCEQGENPSPEYPQEISVIENDLKVVSCNKNLFDKNSTTQLIGYYAQDGSFISDTTNIAFVGIKLPKTEITISSNYKLKKFIGFTSEDYTKGTVLINPINLKTTYKNNGEYKYYGFYVSKEEYEREDFYIQIEKGNIETNFEEHLETVINVNLGNEFVGKIKDTAKDTLRVSYNEEDGEYHLYLDKNLNRLVWNENTSLECTHDTSSKTFQFKDNSIYNDGSNLSITKTTYANHWRYLWNELGCCITYEGKPLIIIPDFEFGFESNMTNEQALTHFKNMLKNNPMIWYYSMIEGEKQKVNTIDLGVIDMPITYDEVTNLFTDSNLMPTINAKYYRNFTETVRNLQINNDTLKNELTSIESRLSALEVAKASVVSESEVVE